MVFYLKRHFGDWTVPPFSGKKHTLLSSNDRASPYLRTPETMFWIKTGRWILPNKSVIAFQTNLVYFLPFLFKLFLNSWWGADAWLSLPCRGPYLRRTCLHLQGNMSCNKIISGELALCDVSLTIVICLLSRYRPVATHSKQTTLYVQGGLMAGDWTSPSVVYA
jgi:hypothetical protein